MNDAGHKETQTALPEPLASMGLWSALNFALPATTLSFASAAVFFIVLLFLQLGSEHELFVLPPPGAFAIGVTAAALAWGIAVRCRRRPGRILPRIWVLLLASIATVAALLGYLFHDQSWPLALAVATLAAAITLAPRLLKLRPDSPMVQHIAPLSLLMILVLILPASCAVRHSIAKQTAERVEHRIQQLRLWTADLNEISQFNWRQIEDNAGAASHAIARLKKLDFESGSGDAEVWHSAALLGREGELAQSRETLTDAVVAGFDPERVPRITDLKEAAVHTNGKCWEAYAAFPALSEIAGSYHQELGRLFHELRDVPASDAALVEYRQHYAAQRDLLKSKLSLTANSWGDNWALFRVAGHEELFGLDHEPLTNLLRIPLTGNEESRFRAGDLAGLSSLPLYEVKRYADNGQGVRGCQPKSYVEHNVDYYRLDCYSYWPRKEGAGADLRIEMRLVYQSAPNGSLHGSALPSEVFFHFLIPDGSNVNEFTQEVMTSLAASTREAHETISGTFLRSGSPVQGFNIRGRTRALTVEPRVVTLCGLTPEPKALMVRVVPGKAHGQAALGD